MKKTFNRILLTAAILPTVGPGCVNEEREAPRPVVPLAFEPVMHAQVRAGGDPRQHRRHRQQLVRRQRLDPRPERDLEHPGPKTPNRSSTGKNCSATAFSGIPNRNPTGPPYQYNLACIGFAPFDAAARCDNSQGVVFDDVDTSTDPGDLRYTLLQANLSQKPERRRHLAPDDPRPLRSQLPRERRLRV